MDAYDGNTARDKIYEILKEKNVSASNFYISKEYVDEASDILKANLEKQSQEKKFNVYDNGFFLNQMLISCSYDSKPCSYNDFDYYHDYFYGSCFSFNNGRTNNASDSEIIYQSDLKNTVFNRSLLLN